MLDKDFEIYDFSAKKFSGSGSYTKIKAKYLIYSMHLQRGIFLFIDEDEHIYYCKSTFEMAKQDYRKNQTKWAVLKFKDRVMPSVPQ